jgi:SAM-dependent methyltransferase
MISKFKEYSRSSLLYWGRKIPQINSIIQQRDEWKYLYLKQENNQEKILSFIQSEYVLNSLFFIDNMSEYKTKMLAANLSNQIEIENLLQAKFKSENSVQHDFLCLVCNCFGPFKIDYQSSDGNLPNWRETLVCQHCFLNNRQRAVARLAAQFVKKFSFQTIYCMEQVTPFFKVIEKQNIQLKVFGSEYLNPEFSPGHILDGIRHEDINNLSFDVNSIDLILSNDCFEHVPSLATSLKECNRVLTSNGLIIATIPFHSQTYQSIDRASLRNGKVVHFLDPIYHGNPVSGEGSLVYCDFGWDIFELFKSCGFSANVHFISLPAAGHLGHDNLIFILKKEHSIENL